MACGSPGLRLSNLKIDTKNRNKKVTADSFFENLRKKIEPLLEDYSKDFFFKNNFPRRPMIESNAKQFLSHLRETHNRLFEDNSGMDCLIREIVKNWMKKYTDLYEDSIRDAEKCPEGVNPDVFVWSILEDREVDPRKWSLKVTMAFVEAQFPVLVKNYPKEYNLEKIIQRWIDYKCDNLRMEAAQELIKKKKFMDMEDE
jgi:hypothetical protein